jgi:hypothetical protein
VKASPFAFPENCQVTLGAANVSAQNQVRTASRSLTRAARL